MKTPNLLLYHEMVRLSSAKFYLTKAWRCGIMGRARGRAHVSCEKIHKRLTLSIPLYHKTVEMSTLNCWLTRAHIYGIMKGDTKRGL